MAREKINIDFNKVYTSNRCGDYKIIEELPPKVFAGATRRMVKVQFINTGYITEAQLPVALSGAIKDPYVVSVLGIGCMGDVSNIEYTKQEYDLWFSMLRRCYSEKDPMYINYGGAGVTVDRRWHCFENFIKDIRTLNGYSDYIIYGGSKYQLDKDLKQEHLPKNQRVYSKDTCCFLPSDYNVSIRAFEYKNSNNCSSDYVGLYQTPSGNYQCKIMIDGVKHFLGTFTNEIAAANAYNYYARHYSGCTINPNIPYMPPVEWTRYRSRAKLMCRVVDDKK